MMNFKRLLLICFICSFAFSTFLQPAQAQKKNFQYIEGGIVRGDTSTKKIALVFTSDRYFDGYKTIRNTLKKQHAKGSFFFTGNAYRNPAFKEIVKKLKADGNYLGAHSDNHLLFCAWEKRDSTLVSKEEFFADIKNNYAEMQRFGIAKADAPYVLPAYEYYNNQISTWTRELGLQIVNFTEGTRSNADYTTPNMGAKYVDSQTLYDNVLNFEKSHSNGLNGFMLMIHFGTEASRTDKFYNRLNDLITELKNRGYSFVSVTELLQ